MADVFSQIYIQTVFAVKNRKVLILPAWEEFHFEWQAGYGAFSYSRSHVDAVCKYILNQKEHHKIRTFEHEFLKILADFEVEIGRKNMFDFFLPD